MSDEPTPQPPQPSEMELLRAEMRAGFQSVAKRFDEVGNSLDGHDKQFVSLDTRLTAMDSRITTAAEESRRHMDVSVESLRADFKVVIDATTATGKKVDRLIASNAVEHAAFLEAVTDQEVRITRLEKG
jgi:hypothetical protein